MSNKEVRIESVDSVMMIFLSELPKCLTSKESIISRSQMQKCKQFSSDLLFLKKTAQLDPILQFQTPLQIQAGLFSLDFDMMIRQEHSDYFQVFLQNMESAKCS